eukprot:1672313-Amphidinium_carterae.1
MRNKRTFQEATELVMSDFVFGASNSPPLHLHGLLPTVWQHTLRRATNSQPSSNRSGASKVTHLPKARVQARTLTRPLSFAEVITVAVARWETNAGIAMCVPHVGANAQLPCVQPHRQAPRVPHHLTSKPRMQQGQRGAPVGWGTRPQALPVHTLRLLC